MALVLTDEQVLLRDTAREFIAERSPIAAFRALRDGVDAEGFSRPLWREMAELGWAGIPFPESVGGAGLGMVELGVVLEESGRTLLASPLVATVLAAGSAVLLGGDEAQRQEVLAPVAAGERLLALALQEGPRFDPWQIATRAEARGDGFILRGAKTFVLDGHVADQFVVVARTAGEPGTRDGVTLLLVDAGAAGVTRQRLRMVDGRNVAKVDFSGVEVPVSAVLGEAGQGAALLEAVLDRAAAGLAAEMLGSMDAAFEKTLAFLKDRVQFGVPIGSFQGLKHRAARMFVELELSRTAVLEALQALDAGAADAPGLVSTAKALVSDANHLITLEGVQMHGGLGVTDEEDIGLFLKRARVAMHTFGGTSFHRDRLATLEGF